MIVMLKLKGQYTPKGKFDDGWTSRPRLAAVDLDNPAELRGIIVCREKNGDEYLGLGSEKRRWWRIVEIFELYDPTEALIEGMYPCAGYMSKAELLKEIEGRKHKNKEVRRDGEDRSR